MYYTHTHTERKKLKLTNQTETKKLCIQSKAWQHFISKEFLYPSNKSVAKQHHLLAGHIIAYYALRHGLNRESLQIKALFYCIDDNNKSR